jgi:hypothetical protein
MRDHDHDHDHDPRKLGCMAESSIVLAAIIITIMLTAEAIARFIDWMFSK